MSESLKFSRPFSLFLFCDFRAVWGQKTLVRASCSEIAVIFIQFVFANIPLYIDINQVGMIQSQDPLWPDLCKRPPWLSILGGRLREVQLYYLSTF